MPAYTATPSWTQITVPTDAPLTLQNLDSFDSLYLATGASAPQPADIGLTVDPRGVKAITTLSFPLWARTVSTTNGPNAPAARVAVVPGLV